MYANTHTHTQYTSTRKQKWHSQIASTIYNLMDSIQNSRLQYIFHFNQTLAPTCLHVHTHAHAGTWHIQDVNEWSYQTIPTPTRPTWIQARWTTVEGIFLVQEVTWPYNQRHLSKVVMANYIPRPKENQRTINELIGILCLFKLATFIPVIIPKHI